jgi:hypothetical protein
MPLNPMKSGLVDLDVSATVMGPQAWQEARNVVYRDDGTSTRRPGLVSHHLLLNAIGTPMDDDLATDYAVNGLFEYRRLRNIPGKMARIFIMKVGNHLLASRWGNDFDIPLAKDLGGRQYVPSFAEAWQESTRSRILIVCTDYEGFRPHYWNGNLSPFGSAAGEVDHWTFLERIKEVPNGMFCRVHNGRLFVADPDGMTVWYSAVNEPLDFTFGGFFETDPEFGRITGFFPTYYGELFIGTERAILRVSFGSGLNPTPQTSYPLTTEQGLMSHNAAARVGNEIMYLSTKAQVSGLYATERFGDIRFQQTSYPVFRRMGNMPPDSWRHAFMVDDPVNQILWVGHSMGGCKRIDAVSGWDYNQNQWLYIENDEIPLSCGAVLHTSRSGRPQVYFGSYHTRVVVGVPGAGRAWTFDPLHKEDRYLSARSDSVDSTSPNDLQARVRIPSVNGWPYTIAQVSVVADRDYFDDTQDQVLVVLRNASGANIVVGTTGGTPAVEVIDHAQGTTGNLVQDLGAGYAVPGTPFDVATAAQDTGWDIAIPVGTIPAHHELHLYMDRGQKRTETWLVEFSDMTSGLRNTTRLGSELKAKNFISVLETGALVFQDPSQEFNIEGITVTMRVTGNLADDKRSGSPFYDAQNPYRWHVDMYFRGDDDEDFTQVALLEGNSRKAPHLDESKNETDGKFPTRTDLQHVLPTDGTEASGTAMARNRDVSTHFVPIRRSVKLAWLRFDNATAMSQDHVGEDGAYGIRQSDFTIVSLHFHVKPAAISKRTMDEGSTTELSEMGA